MVKGPVTMKLVTRRLDELAGHAWPPAARREKRVVTYS
jgi:hypothetical protein